MTAPSLERRFSLDSNILVYAADRDADGRRREIALTLMTRAARCDCVLTLQSLTEFYFATTRKRLLRPGEASGFVGDWLDVFRVVPSDAGDLVDAMRIREERPVSFWDAMLWATARRAGCSAILSEDFQDGQVLRGVRFINPFHEENHARVDVLLGG